MRLVLPGRDDGVDVLDHEPGMANIRISRGDGHKWQQPAEKTHLEKVSNDQKQFTYTIVGMFDVCTDIL
jgi:hypothetical protein